MTRPKQLLDDCFLTDKERMSFAEASSLLKARLKPVAGIETIGVAAARGRVLAEDIVAPRPIPASDNAAVDGYAFAHKDYLASDGHFTVVQRIAAGHPADAPLGANKAARIFTGAVMPAGADTVAMQEDASLSEDGRTVAVPPGLKAGANRRRAGEDQQQGALVLPAGTLLRPQELAAIAATGRADVAVYSPLRIASISTGDELVRPGEPLPPGGVYDSNQAMLKGLVAATGHAVEDLGVLPDREGAVRSMLEGAAERFDIVLTTGGASRGEEDYLVGVMDRIGSRHVWQLAIKPGRPMMFGQIGDTVVLSLPGNPVAVFVCFLLFARPVIHVLTGAPYPQPVRYPLPAAFEIRKKKPDRREFLRGILVHRGDGSLAVDKFPRDGSGLISGLTASQGLIEIAEELTSVSPGETVSFIPYSEFGL